MMERMSYPQAIILAIIQALTEFLPISSSGHLVVFQKLLGFSESFVLFDILVHVGTLGAVVFYFRKRLARILNGLKRMDKKSWGIVLMVIVGSIPVVIAGLFLQRYIEPLFNSLRLVGVCLLITAGLLLSTRWVSKKFTRSQPPALGEPKARSGSRDEVGKGLSGLSWVDALFVGLFQALAILPGVSRSGSTIAAGFWRKLDREAAFHFSFYLAIPAIVGAMILQLPELVSGQFSYLNQSLLGMFAAGLIGYFALIALRRILLKEKLWLFGIYCLFLGLTLLFF